jgi:glycosyltransferase involved in cell wall biosynthesis
MLDTASLIHYTSQDELDLASDLGIAAPATVLPHPFDFDAFSTAAGGTFREKYMRDPTAHLVMNIGRLSHKKGLDRLIEAFASVLDTCPSAELSIVGPDDEGLERSLKSLAAERGFLERISFPGLLTGEDLLSATAAADVWTLPSHTENLGLVVLEALAARRAVVITPDVNIASDLREAGGAIVVPADDPAVFGGAIARLLADPVARNQVALNGQQFALRFSHHEIAPRLRDMYERAVGGHHA